MSSPSRSRSTSRSSSPASSRGDRSPVISPEPQSNALTRISMEMDAPQGKMHLFSLVLNGSAVGVKNFCDQLNARADLLQFCKDDTYEHEGRRGTLLHMAAYFNRRSVMRPLLDACGAATEEVVSLVSSVVLALLREERYSVALHLLKCCPQASVHVLDEARNDYLLHCVCRLPRPPMWFVDDILELMSSCQGSTSSALVIHQHSMSPVAASRLIPPEVINRQNSNGFTALHLASMVLKGAAGRQIVRLLLRYGADETIINSSGKTAAEVCKNGYIREELTLIAAHRRGRAPKLDPKTKALIDECGTSDKFPELPEIKEADDAVAAEQQAAGDKDDEEEEGTSRRKRNAPLSLEEQDALVNRLFDSSIKAKEKWFTEKYQELEEQDRAAFHSKLLSSEDLDASVSRLCQESMDHIAEKMTELLTKYIPEKSSGAALEREELEASCERLSRGSLEKRAATTQQLTATYAPPRPSKKLSKAAMEASAQRLWKECQEKTGVEMAKLFESYCCPPKGRFNGGIGPLSPERVKTSADRLSKKA